MSHTTIAASMCFLILFIASSSAIGVRPTYLKQQDLAEAVVPVVPPAKKCSANVSSECLADDCCNWCGLYFNATIGFCLPMLPKPVPALVCQRAPPSCSALLSVTDCASSDTCKWIPTGSPLSPTGLCIYDWAKCKAPVAAAVSAAPVASLSIKRTRNAAAAAAVDSAVRTAAPPPPAVKLACNNTTPAECDARPCCQWCGGAGPAAAGFCMPVLQWPAPSLTCSKGTGSCAAGAAGAADCAASGPACSWHPFGPPGSAGPGVCVFDWDKCAAAEE